MTVMMRVKNTKVRVALRKGHAPTPLTQKIAVRNSMIEIKESGIKYHSDSIVIVSAIFRSCR